jgi:hypothetical protein
LVRRSCYTDSMFIELYYFRYLISSVFLGVEVPESCLEWNKDEKRTVKLITS